MRFEAKSLYGFQTIDMMAVSFTDKVVLDIWDMDIYKVEVCPPGSADAARQDIEVTGCQSIGFKVLELNPVIGQTLAIQLPYLVQTGNLISVRI